MLRVQEITASYGRQTVLKALSATFERGRITALVGPNGCGKSTLLKAIMGFLPISRGNIWLEDRPIRTIGRKQLARRIAYLPQECQCPDHMTLGELIELAGYSRYSLIAGPSAHDRRLFAEILELVGLADKAGCQVNHLSGGQRQRAFIAMVLAQEADIILMDEPVNHLDMKYQYAVLTLVRELSTQHAKTVILVVHDLNLASAFADDIVMLRDGEVVAAGRVQETISAANVELAFDFKADIFSRQGRVVCLPSMIAKEAIPA